MKNQNYQERNNKPQYLLVDEKLLQQLIEKQDLILELLNPKKQKADVDTLGDYITEKKAKELLGKGATWFWNIRQKGFPHEKMGATVYYLKSDLIKLIESDKNKT